VKQRAKGHEFAIAEEKALHPIGRVAGAAVRLPVDLLNR
jgi:hypothetical protein